jgi:hypothetical protein
MEQEGLLPHSQEPDTCFYSKPKQASPCSTIPFLEYPLNIILPAPGSSLRPLPSDNGHVENNYSGLKRDVAIFCFYMKNMLWTVVRFWHGKKFFSSYER